MRGENLIRRVVWGAALVVLGGCGDAAFEGSAGVGAPQMDVFASSPEMEAMAGSPAGELIGVRELPPEIELGASQQNAPDPGVRRLIRNGSVRLEVDDLDAGMETVRALLDDAGAYVARSEERSTSGGGRAGSLTIRVPSEGFDALMSQIEGMGRLVASTSGVEDVTREYVDVETRVAVGEETVARLRALGARGGGLSDLLAVEREVGRALAELESLKGRLRYYDQRIAESELSVYLTQPGRAMSGGALRPIRVALQNASRLIVESVAAMIYVVATALPWAIALGLIGFFVRRWWVRRRTA